MASTTATVADLWRLAEEARRRGIKVLIEPISNQYFATSATDPKMLYRVTGFSCTCKGYLAWQRCTHHSLLLAELGWLPDPEDDPDPPAAPALVMCPECRGRGTELVEAKSGDWFRVPCFLCEGSGHVEDGEPDDGDADTSRVDTPYDGHGVVIPIRRTPTAGPSGEAVEDGLPPVDPRTGRGAVRRNARHAA